VDPRIGSWIVISAIWKFFGSATCMTSSDPRLAIELARRMPSRRIHMVGGPQPGYSDLYSKIESAAKSLPNLTFCGRVPYHDVGDLYDRAKIFVNTSDTEGFPNSFLQSWRRGVPVISFFDPDGLIKCEGLGASPQSIDEMAYVADHLIANETEWRKASERCREFLWTGCMAITWC
jgi:hypothetical protein